MCNLAPDVPLNSLTQAPLPEQAYLLTGRLPCGPLPMPRASSPPSPPQDHRLQAAGSPLWQAHLQPAAGSPAPAVISMPPTFLQHTRLSTFYSRSAGPIPANISEVTEGCGDPWLKDSGGFSWGAAGIPAGKIWH